MRTTRMRIRTNRIVMPPAVCAADRKPPPIAPSSDAIAPGSACVEGVVDCAANPRNYTRRRARTSISFGLPRPSSGRSVDGDPEDPVEAHDDEAARERDDER